MGGRFGALPFFVPAVLIHLQARAFVVRTMYVSGSGGDSALEAVRSPGWTGAFWEMTGWSPLVRMSWNYRNCSLERGLRAPRALHSGVTTLRSRTPSSALRALIDVAARLWSNWAKRVEMQDSLPAAFVTPSCSWQPMHSFNVV
jgi:hypothetical protein